MVDPALIWLFRRAFGGLVAVGCRHQPDATYWLDQKPVHDLVVRPSQMCRRVTPFQTDSGFTDALSWITRHAPGPRVVAGLEGTRSYGIGLARALTTAGVRVIEVEQPRKADRRDRGKSDPIDAHWAAVNALRRDVNTLPTPRADGAREALRILLAERVTATRW